MRLCSFKKKAHSSFRFLLIRGMIFPPLSLKMKSTTDDLEIFRGAM